MFFTATGPAWLPYFLAAGIAGLYLAARRERFRLRDWPTLPWREKLLSTVAFAGSAIFAVYYFGYVIPDANQDWRPIMPACPS